jgi:hypothetical protein
MKKQDNTESNNQQSAIEDLTVNEDQAEAVKSGTGIKTVRFKAGKDLQDIS